MDFSELLPMVSLVVIPAVGWLHRQLSKLTQESVEQEQQIEATQVWLKNLDAAMARRSELDVLNTRIDGLTDRLSRAEATVDRLRNGTHK